MRLVFVCLFATLVILTTASFSQSFNVITVQDTVGADGRITADTLFTPIRTGNLEQVVISCKLQDLGGSGTYCPIILTSMDSLEWDTLRTDTLTVEEQNTVWTLSIYDAIRTGGGGNTAAGANTAGVALSRWLGIYIDEIGADTGGSELWIQVLTRERR